jgi:hypothetical protein
VGQLDAEETKLWSKSSISNSTCILDRCSSVGLQLLTRPLNRSPTATLPSPYGATVAFGMPKNLCFRSACSFSYINCGHQMQQS